MSSQSAFITINHLTNLEDKSLVAEIMICSRALLRSVDISGKMYKLIITGLLNKLAKFDSELLEKIVQEDLIFGSEMMPVGNQCAIAVAIAHDMGKNAPLLDEVLNNPRIPEEVKSRIIRERES